MIELWPELMPRHTEKRGNDEMSAGKALRGGAIECRSGKPVQPTQSLQARALLPDSGNDILWMPAGGFLPENPLSCNFPHRGNQGC